jgi:hypothetical protein
MNLTTLKIFAPLIFLVGCVQFQPIGVYDIVPEINSEQQERIFFDETKGLLWTNLANCGELSVVRKEDNNVLLLDWNKVDCDWVGFGNSWSAFVADDISEIYQSSAITFKIKAVGSPQNSVAFVIGLDDYAGGSSYVFTHSNLYADKLVISNDEWTTYYMPLWDYDFSEAGVDPYGIKQMVIQLEGSGKVFLDDIQVIPFTKEQYQQMLSDVENSKEKGNPNQEIYPANLAEMAWGTGKTDCQILEEKDMVIDWSWSDCKEWKAWGINWTDWYAFSLRGIVDETELHLQIGADSSPFELTLEDFNGHKSTVQMMDYIKVYVNDTVVSVTIPLTDFKINEKEFVVDRMKQLEFTGVDAGNAKIYNIKLSEK